MELSRQVAELQTKVANLEAQLRGRPSQIQSPDILSGVIEMGFADSATKARDFLAKHKIGNAKELFDYAVLDVLNRTNKPLVTQDD